VSELIAPGYAAVISRPMALSTVCDKLDTYTSFAEFESDIKLMIDNCKEYNKVGDIFYAEFYVIFLRTYYFTDT
jgi:transcription initiation factor TFIID subunit 2